MSLLAVLLAAVGVADLARPHVPRSLWSRIDLVPLVAAGVAVLVAFGLGYRWHSLWVAVLVALVMLGWIRQSHRWLPAALPGAAVVALLAGQQVPRERPPISGWYSSLDIPGLATVSIPAAALAFGVALFLVQSANVAVRRVLTGAGPGVLEEGERLKGGRILGPVERLAIFALALSGNVAAISAVIAAKGILRFPEISRDADSGLRAEYVLVGSFVSWGLALVFVPLF